MSVQQQFNREILMEMVCKDCGTVDRPARVTKGSIWIEIILWLCFLVPGVIYSIWRLTTRHDSCGACGSKSIVPLDSPIGRKIAAENGYSEATRRVGSAESLGRSLGRMMAGKK